MTYHEVHAILAGGVANFLYSGPLSVIASAYVGDLQNQ
jgi:hypothetical protein